MLNMKLKHHIWELSEETLSYSMPFREYDINIHISTARNLLKGIMLCKSIQQSLWRNYSESLVNPFNLTEIIAVTVSQLIFIFAINTRT